ncbi:MAG: formylglycine-generating enzyme family protein [Vicinamibacterales bacterium]
MFSITPRCALAVAGRSFAAAALVVIALLISGRATPRVVRAQEVNPHSLAALLDGTGFVQIRAGEFRMGSTSGIASEAPVHPVRIAHAFEIGKFEVTQGQWEAVMGSAHAEHEPGKVEPPSANDPSHFKGLTRPVENVSWNDVQRFLVVLNSRDTSHIYRLPTEAEWEYAAKAGSTADAPPNLTDSAWFESNADSQTQPAGQKKPNAWGLYDMHGNVSEWVSDWFGLDTYANSPATDPAGPVAGSYKLYRGCSWLSPGKDCRAAVRTFNFPIDGLYNVGFRLVRTPR